MPLKPHNNNNNNTMTDDQSNVANVINKVPTPSSPSYINPPAFNPVQLPTPMNQPSTNFKIIKF